MNLRWKVRTVGGHGGKVLKDDETSWAWQTMALKKRKWYLT